MKTWTLSLLLPLIAAPCFGTHVAITTNTLPNGTVGTAYSSVIQASGGCIPYAWSIVSGSLPAGLTVKPSSTTTALNFAGTPRTAGTYSFTAQVAACNRYVANNSYKIIIQSTANHVVDLSWNASTMTNVAGYNIYRAPDGVTWKKINLSLIGSTVYADSTVANGSTYYFAATTVDVYGHESSKTAPVKVVIP